MAISLASGRRATLSKVDAFADGVAVKSVSCQLQSKTLAVYSLTDFTQGVETCCLPLLHFHVHFEDQDHLWHVCLQPSCCTVGLSFKVATLQLWDALMRGPLVSRIELHVLQMKPEP